MILFSRICQNIVFHTDCSLAFFPWFGIQHRYLSKGCPIQREFRDPFHSTRWCSMSRILWNYFSITVFSFVSHWSLSVWIRPALSYWCYKLSVFFLLVYFLDVRLGRQRAIIFNSLDFFFSIAVCVLKMTE